MENEILCLRLEADKGNAKLDDKKLFLNGPCQAGNFPTDNIFPVTLRAQSGADEEMHELDATAEFCSLLS